jgi:hypothetical protein
MERRKRIPKTLKMLRIIKMPRINQSPPPKTKEMLVWRRTNPRRHHQVVNNLRNRQTKRQHRQKNEINLFI